LKNILKIIDNAIIIIQNNNTLELNVIMKEVVSDKGGSGVNAVK
jgi:hypothetical protein